tara:strand:+ start:32134 stop:34815 length:2682 start_codon:yes stop_codon:yes gene_type:complete
MVDHNRNFIVRFSKGTGRNFGKAKNQSKSLKSFRDMFRKPTVTKERLKDYLKLPDKEQAQLKSVDGWIYRTQVDGPVRNRGSGLPSDMLTFDFDYATPEFFQSILDGERLTRHEWFLHTSRRHTAENPRFRIFVFLDEPVPNDLYVPVSRIVAQQIDPDMEHVDKVSFRPAQMMFMPTISKDGEYVFHENHGELLDWSAELDAFEATRGDWRDITQLPQVPGENARETAEKAEDPTEKSGIVGDFCRAYNVIEAIDAFELPYEEVDAHSGKPRYTYTGGTTTNGAEVQDDGLFLYSHHGSDPCSDMLVNAFDLVRIHKYGEKDEKVDFDETPMSKRPSFKAFVEDLQHDEKFKAQQVASRYDMAAINADFDDAMADEDIEFDEEYDPEVEALIGTPKREEEVKTEVEEVEPPQPNKAKIPQKRKKKEPPKENWIQGLQLTQDGIIVANSPNVAQIIQNDLRTRNSLEFNEFTERTVTRHPLRTKMEYIADFHIADPVNGDVWEDIHTTSVRAMIESENGPGKTGYGFKVSDRDMDSGIELAARKSKFHPVREYLESLSPAPEAVAESLFTKFMGSPDTPYYREASRNWLVGAVARVYEPGSKFDYVPILHGAQGKGKSTFIRILACNWFGELKADFREDAKLVEQMFGCWIMEMPELSSINRSQVEDAKAFTSATETHVRLAWARRSKVFKRQCVFMGSTNDERFLIDSTGNRRWWPIEVLVEMIDNHALLRERDTIWGAAVAIYKAMREEQPEGVLDLSLQSKEAREEALELQEAARVETEVDHYANLIANYLDEKVRSENEDDFDINGPLRHREYVHASELWMDVLEMSAKQAPNDTRALNNALKKNGWIPSTGARHHARFNKKMRVYIPGPGVLARWKREEEEEAGNDLI